MNTKQIKNLCAASASVDGGERERDAPHIHIVGEEGEEREGNREGDREEEGRARNYATIKYNSKQSEIYRCPHWMTMITMMMMIGSIASLRDDHRDLVATAADHGRSYDHSDRSMIMPFRSSLHAAALA